MNRRNMHPDEKRGPHKKKPEAMSASGFFCKTETMEVIPNQRLLN